MSRCQRGAEPRLVPARRHWDEMATSVSSGGHVDCPSNSVGEAERIDFHRGTSRGRVLTVPGNGCKGGWYGQLLRIGRAQGAHFYLADDNMPSLRGVANVGFTIVGYRRTERE